MLFHTWEFALFFLVVMAGLVVARLVGRGWLLWLLIASGFFYASWNPYYLFLIVYSTLLDFACVWCMDGGSNGGESRFLTRRFWLVVSVVNNLALLAFFKYANFFIDNFNVVLERLGATWRLDDVSAVMPFGWEYLLPVGISFYTFQSLSYTIDFYRGRIPRERNLIRFATFVSFFPQLVAGPIERSSRLLPQLYDLPPFRLQNLTDGASVFLVGLFKKVALANYLAPYVERVYGNPTEYDASALLMATFCFAWEIYFDFSGYTDMARGVAKAMGFDLMMNFDNPYTATGLGDFWARWHISLSTWFRDYVYIPLGGSRHGPWRTYSNLLIVFVVSGLWHGPNWTFVVWGALHALGIVATRQLERSRRYRESVPRWIKQTWTFFFVCFSWIFFRAESMSDAMAIVQGIFAGSWHDPHCPVLLLVMVLLVWCYELMAQSRLARWLELSAVNVVLATLMIGYLILCAAEGGEFIYFQF